MLRCAIIAKQASRSNEGQMLQPAVWAALTRQNSRVRLSFLEKISVRITPMAPQNAPATSFAGMLAQGGMRAFSDVACVCHAWGEAVSAHFNTLGRRQFLTMAAGAAAGAMIGAGKAKADPESEPALPQLTIYTARRIITMDDARPSATAIAVQAGRILSVGTLAEVEAALKGQTYVIDPRFAGKVLTPGLIEQHLHPVLAALSMSCEVIANDEWDLPDRTAPACETPDDYRTRLASAVNAVPGDTSFFASWGFHQYWHGELSRALLDEISATRPIAVWHRSCHEFYLNTAALNAFGITEEMTRGHGLASEQADWHRGHFFEKGLNLILAPLMAAFATPERLVRGLTLLKTYMHRAGVTALNEPGAQIGPEQLALYQSVLGHADTPFTTTLIVDGRTMYERHRTDALARTREVIASASGGKVRFLDGQIKFFADGAIVSQKMQMRDGYTDGHRGEWMTEPENFKAAWQIYWDAGFNPHIHVNGDLGLDMVLDTLDAALARAPRDDHRTVIVHFANSTEEQVERIAHLKAVVSANPYYVPAFADAYGNWGLGPERADNMTRLGSCVRAGVPVSLHSDMPIGPARPLFNVWAAVNRKTVSGRIAGPDQRLSVHQALRAVTLDAAHSWRLDHEMGSLVPGKLANITVLEDDPEATAPEALKDIAIWGTIFEGRVFAVS